MKRVLASMLVGAAVPCAASGQLLFTEVMYDPPSGGTWDWIEVYNPTGAAVDISGYFFDDLSGSDFGSSNIPAGVIPAGEAAVLVNGAATNIDAAAFQAAWGGSVNVIETTLWPAISTGDTLGLWAPGSYAGRATGAAAAYIDFDNGSNGWPALSSDGSSLAINPGGNTISSNNWSTSVDGVNGAYTSSVVNFQHSAADVGNPGVAPGGAPAAGLLITEIMYNPNTLENSSTAAEWVEIYNNTGSAIDFGVTAGAFDDDDGSALAAANITSGTVGIGETAVLYNAETYDGAAFAAAWGGGINAIGVTEWSGLSNGGDEIGIWLDFLNYVEDDFTTADATVDTDDSAPWPVDDGFGSITLNGLGDDPTDGANWSLSSVGDAAGSFNSSVTSLLSVNNPGLDVGSPGFVPQGVIPEPTTAALLGLGGLAMLRRRSA